MRNCTGSVTPGDDFTHADAIEDVVLKGFDGRIIRAGAFYFRLEDFDQLPITVICIGSGGNFEIGVSLDDIRF